MRFADIPDHADVKRRLREMVDNDRIPHALLLEGPQGSGKFMLARALAQYIHCENRTPDGDSCGRCPACRQHETFNHIDTIFTFPVVKKRGEGLSDEYLPEFREYITEYPYMDFEQWLTRLDNINSQPAIYVQEANSLIQKLNYTAHNARYKIVLLWLPERMREDTANKLLKLIEEPHGDTLFILVSNNSQRILPTIYSRTQRVVVKRYDIDTVAGILQNSAGIDPDSAREAARIAEGNVAEAFRQINVNAENSENLKMMITLMRNAYTRKVKVLKQWSVDLSKAGREPQMKFYEYCCRMMRENFILNLGNRELSYLNPEEMAFSKNFAPFITARNVEQLCEVFQQAINDIAANGNAKIINFDVAIKVILLLK